MLTTYLIPLTNTPQVFAVDLAGVTYMMTNKWNNSPDGGWILDIADSANNPIVCGLPFVTGVNILSGLDYLGIGGTLTAYTDGDPTAVPTLDNLGAASNLYFQTDVANG